ncbi:metallophosphoesterase [Aestuariivivens sp. NBU2969]|uniref:metallophosphoesterase family protein n=1 Tax=Aestuariivivens sp. NBU2969 TaxID=2873267 RepID=UPI001CBE0A72|nr:metallophosphoesterase [Aestuariivivens sp. NBU2969]
MNRICFLYLTRFFIFIIVIVLCVDSCKPYLTKFDTNNLKIAVLADIHFQDVYGKFKDLSIGGIKNPKNGKMVTMRTMESQLKSTRIFNENYFALLAALDDLVKKNIKLVLLPGDFLDDGQPIHARGLKKILDDYNQKYGIEFFLITGNHDILQPFVSKGGKKDFLGNKGMPQPIMSHDDMYTSNLEEEHPVIVTEDIKSLGYIGISTIFADFGFSPKKEYVYWETPFSNYNYETYSFEKALENASIRIRKNSSKHYKYGFPDISYLVEPVSGVWLLALDANVYVAHKNSENEVFYPGVGIGYNNLINNKNYLIDWVKKVTQQAKKLNKKLIAFSHYPIVDFNDGAIEHIKNLNISDQMQLERAPKNEVSEAFADAGLKIHFGGHMHINDTGIYKSALGNTIINIQTPSLAAYKPAYKLLTIKTDSVFDIETVIIDDVPRYDELFDLYIEEYTFVKGNKPKSLWNKDILSTKSYNEFANWHLKELVRLRHLTSEWPLGFVDYFTSLSGSELLVMSQGIAVDSLDERLIKIKQNPEKIDLDILKGLKEMDQDLKDFDNWSGFDFIFDLYRYRSADHLATRDIESKRIEQYRFIIDSFLEQEHKVKKVSQKLNQILELMQLFKKFMNGEPSDHIKVNLKTGKVISIN